MLSQTTAVIGCGDGRRGVAVMVVVGMVVVMAVVDAREYRDQAEVLRLVKRDAVPVFVHFVAAHNHLDGGALVNRLHAHTSMHTHTQAYIHASKQPHAQRDDGLHTAQQTQPPHRPAQPHTTRASAKVMALSAAGAHQHVRATVQSSTVM